MVLNMLNIGRSITSVIIKWVGLLGVLGGLATSLNAQPRKLMVAAASDLKYAQEYTIRSSSHMR